MLGRVWRRYVEWCLVDGVFSCLCSLLLVYLCEGDDFCEVVGIGCHGYEGEAYDFV